MVEFVDRLRDIAETRDRDIVTALCTKGHDF